MPASCKPAIRTQKKKMFPTLITVWKKTGHWDHPYIFMGRCPREVGVLGYPIMRLFGKRQERCES